MATLRSSASGGVAEFTPISAALANLPNAAATVAVLVKPGATASRDFAGLLNAALGTWYHTLAVHAVGELFDDDGLIGVHGVTAVSPATTDWWIFAVTWAAGAAAKERVHWKDVTTNGTPGHEDSAGNNGGTRAGPGTTGHFRIGDANDFGSNGSDTALVGVWAGVRLTDAQVNELAANLRTSDWWNNSAGRPTLLVECTSVTPTDIGANPSTFSSVASMTAAGGNPPGWNFDGQGGGPPNRLKRRM